MKTRVLHAAAAIAALGLVVIVVVAGCAPRPAATLPTPAAVDDPDTIYRIGIPDLLAVRVWQHDDLSGPALVRRDGRISVPLIGDVVAAGSTPEALARLIEVRLADYVAEPQVDVAVTEMRSQVVSVIGGGVARSGVVELRSNMRVIDAIAEMGGLTPFARKRAIRVVRNTPDGEVEYGFDYAAFVAGEAPGSNFALAPGDTVIVPE